MAIAALSIGCSAQAQLADRDSPKDARERADALLDDDLPSDTPTWNGLRGFYQFEGAYTLPSPSHWSKLRNRLELGSQGQISESVKWKVSARADYDAIYSLSDFYPAPVKKDQRFEADFRETYLDIAAGNLEFRLGRQQIVWGEVVGLFFADVVSAKDLRESLVQDFDLLRIPQWAARAEYFKNDIHLEAIWIPFPGIDQIGRPGSAFFPYPPPPPAGYGYVINNEIKPRQDGSVQDYGLRASILRGGWDVAAFAYRSVDANPAFFRQIVQGPTPAFVYTPRHEKITQYGATASKDFDDFLLKAEAVYTMGQDFSTTTIADGDGLTAQNYFDYILSAEVPVGDNRFNAALFQRLYKHHDEGIYPRRIESGATLFWSGKLTEHVKPEVLLIHSLNRNDWLLRPKLVWDFRKNWRAVFGVDVFGGHPTGLFGQYDKQDRLYSEVRVSF